MGRSVLALCLLSACSMAPTSMDARAEAAPGCEVLRGRAPGGAPLAVAILDGHFAPADACDGVIDLEDGYLVPGVIDSHVHLAYHPVADELARGGIAVAVDLASPIGFLDEETLLPVLRAGPMIAAPAGYPTRSWGANGYGVECGSTAECVAAVDALAAAGGDVVKISLGAGPDLDEVTLRAVIDRAHALQLPVAAHALDDAAARRAAEARADVLAHTPTQRLSAETVALWSTRRVVSTLGAFGGSADATDNLARLRAAGATVLYGTDLGNTRTVGIDAREIELLTRAGLDGRAIVEAMTSAPAEAWGLATYGSFAPGGTASFLVVAEDPTVNPATLASPTRVYLQGVRVDR